MRYPKRGRDCGTTAQRKHAEFKPVHGMPWYRPSKLATESAPGPHGCASSGRLRIRTWAPRVLKLCAVARCCGMARGLTADVLDAPCSAVHGRCAGALLCAVVGNHGDGTGRIRAVLQGVCRTAPQGYCARVTGACLRPACVRRAASLRRLLLLPLPVMPLPYVPDYARIVELPVSLFECLVVYLFCRFRHRQIHA